MTEDTIPQLEDRVALNLPEAVLIGKVTGILTRIDHTHYEVLWNDTSVGYYPAIDLKAYKPYE